MKFTLKDYQVEAVYDVLTNLRKARKRWREDGDKCRSCHNGLTSTRGCCKGEGMQRPRTVAFLGWVEKSQSKDVWSYRMFGAAVASPHIYGPKEKAAIGLLNHILSLMEGNS